MPTDKAESDARASTQRIIDQVLKFPEEKLTREELSVYSFSSSADQIERARSLLLDFNEDALRRLGKQQLVQVQNTANAILTCLTDIAQFNPLEGENPNNRKKELETRIANGYDSWLQTLLPLIAYVTAKSSDFEQLRLQARGTLKEIEKVQSDAKRESDTLIKDAESALATIRKAAQEIGVSQHAIHFKQAADEFDKAANDWLKYTFGLGAVTAVLALLMLVLYLFVDRQKINDFSWQLGVAKLTILTVSFYLLVLAAKTYRANRHNWIVNRHRHNALSTFQAFVDAASADASTKNAVLLQATMCIFSPQQSGYAAPEGDSDSYPKVLEIVRDASGKP